MAEKKPKRILVTVEGGKGAGKTKFVTEILLQLQGLDGLDLTRVQRAEESGDPTYIGAFGEGELWLKIKQATPEFRSAAEIEEADQDA